MLYKNFHPEDAPFFLSATGFRFLVSTVSVSASSEEADDSTDVRVATVDDVDDSSPEVASLRDFEASLGDFDFFFRRCCLSLSLT